MLSSFTTAETGTQRFHLFSNYGEKARSFLHRLDHLGIIIVMWGSMIASDHFGFHDEHGLRNVYWAAATSAALGCAWTVSNPKFRTLGRRNIQFYLFALLGLFAFAAKLHGVLLHGYAAQDERMSLSHFILLGLLQFAAGAIYAARIPERWCPRRFDILGASHQLMHVIVMFGALSYSIGLVEAVGYWHARGAAR